MYEPMLAECVPESTLDLEDYLYEVKLDGTRCIAVIEPNHVTLYGRGKLGSKFTERFPEVVEALKCAVWPRKGITVLDGELVCWKDGKPNFNAVAGRAHRQKDLEAARRANPVVFHAFDCLYVHGVSLLETALIERKAILSGLLSPAGGIMYLGHQIGQGRVLYEWVKQQGLEGVMCKDPASIYQEGKRSKSWGKIKVGTTEMFRVEGYTAGTGNRKNTLGALILSEQDDNGDWRYVGKCGGGMSDADLQYIKALTTASAVRRKVAGIPSNLKVTYLKEPIKLYVKYMERTENGLLRMARIAPCE